MALPFSARLRDWGPIPRRRGRTVGGAIARLQIDMRAAEVQRLSGGNQQKVTIARWIAADARTMLCFDPTRGIDVRTKQEIYRLLRDLAAGGKSVLFYTSDLEEVPVVADRVVVIFTGRVVDVSPPRGGRGDADPGRLWPAEECAAASGDGDMIPVRREAGSSALSSSSSCSSSPPGWCSRTTAAVTSARSPAPLCPSLRDAAQMVVVLAGGIDLSIASMMALTSVTAAG